MYAVYGNIYHQYTPNVSIYIPYMDPMGYRSQTQWIDVLQDKPFEKMWLVSRLAAPIRLLFAQNGVVP